MAVLSDYNCEIVYLVVELCSTSYKLLCLFTGLIIQNTYKISHRSLFIFISGIWHCRISDGGVSGTCNG